MNKGHVSARSTYPHTEMHLDQKMLLNVNDGLIFQKQVISWWKKKRSHCSSAVHTNRSRRTCLAGAFFRRSIWIVSRTKVASDAKQVTTKLADRSLFERKDTSLTSSEPQYSRKKQLYSVLNVGQTDRHGLVLEGKKYLDNVDWMQEYWFLAANIIKVQLKKLTCV